MNVQTNFLADAHLRNAVSPAPDARPIVVTDLESASRMPDHETFWLVAAPVRRLVSCGRVGIEFQLPNNAAGSAERRLMAWINAESHDTETVLSAAGDIGGRPIPVRRSRGGFHVSFDALRRAAA